MDLNKATRYAFLRPFAAMSRTLLDVYACAEAELSSAEKTKKIKTIKRKKKKQKQPRTPSSSELSTDHCTSTSRSVVTNCKIVLKLKLVEVCFCAVKRAQAELFL